MEESSGKPPSGSSSPQESVGQLSQIPASGENPRRVLRAHATRQAFNRIGFDVLNRITSSGKSTESLLAAPSLAERPSTPREEALLLATTERDNGNFQKVKEILTEAGVNPDYKWRLDSALLKEEAIRAREENAEGPIEVEIYEDPVRELSAARVEIAYAMGDPALDLQRAIEYAEVHKKIRGSYPYDFEEGLAMAEEAFQRYNDESNNHLREDPELIAKMGEELARAYTMIGKGEKAQELFEKYYTQES